MGRATEAAISDEQDVSDDTNDFDPKADILPDSLFDKHIRPVGGKSTQKPVAAADDLDDEDSDDDDTLDDEDLDDEELDDEDEDDGGEQDDSEEQDDDEDDEDLDDEDDDEEEEEEDEADESDVLSNLTAAELKEIEKDPRLRKSHKLMQRQFTKRTTEVSERERVVEQREIRNNGFEQAIQTPRGMAAFLARNLEDHPDVIGAAFEAVATGDGGENFLVEVGLHNPDLLDKAYQRVQELVDDEDAKERHEQSRNNTAESSRIARDKLRLSQERFETQAAPLISFAERVATKAGIHVDDVATVRKAVEAKLKDARKDNGSIDLTKDDIKAVVRTVKKDLDTQFEKVASRLGRRNAKKRQEEVKDKLKKRKPVRSEDRRGEHGGATKRTADRKSRDDSPTNVGDSIFGYIDQRLGTNKRIARPQGRKSKHR